MLIVVFLIHKNELTFTVRYRVLFIIDRAFPAAVILVFFRTYDKNRNVRPAFSLVVNERYAIVDFIPGYSEENNGGSSDKAASGVFSKEIKTFPSSSVQIQSLYSEFIS